MIDEKYQELMNRTVDETLAPDEQADLEAYLKANPEARRYYDQLQKVAGLLARVPRTNAPDGFASSVMSSIRDRGHELTAQSQKGLFARIAEAFRSGRGWRYTYVFSAGLACGILILAAATHFSESSPGVDAAHVSATMSSTIPRTMTLIEKQDVAIGAVRGTVEVRRGDGTVVIDGNMPSSDESEIKLAYDANDLVPAAIWQPEPYTGGVSTDQNTINFHFPGECHFRVVFRDRSPFASIITCRIATGGESRTWDLKTESSAK